MSGIGNALIEGETFARGLAADERKAHAYNALANTYGVALAGDPETAKADQDYMQHERTNPIAVDQAQAALTGTNLDNTGKQQTNDYNALANPKNLAGLDLQNQKTSAETEERQAQTKRVNYLLPGEMAQQGATLRETNAQTGLANSQTAHTNVETQQGRLALNTTQAAQDRQSAMGILASLSDVASAGGDVGAKFDTLAPLIAKFEGVDPSHMAPMRAALVQDPVGTINKLSEAIQAANLTALGANGKGGAGALALMKFSQGQMSLKDGLNFTKQRIQAVPEMTQQALALVPQMASVATVRKAKAMIPGTPEYRFEQAVKQIQSNLSLDDLRALREGGLSLGRTNMAEFAGSASAVANMDLGQTPSMLSGNLKRINNTYGEVNKALDSQIQRLGAGGGGGGGVPKATQPSNKFQEGVIYTDAQGNKAKFQSGQWVPVK
jgi:hypothetical protein